MKKLVKIMSIAVLMASSVGAYTFGKETYTRTQVINMLNSDVVYISGDCSARSASRLYYMMSENGHERLGKSGFWIHIESKPYIIYADLSECEQMLRDISRRY